MFYAPFFLDAGVHRDFLKCTLVSRIDGEFPSYSAGAVTGLIFSRRWSELLSGLRGRGESLFSFLEELNTGPITMRFILCLLIHLLIPLGSTGSIPPYSNPSFNGDYCRFERADSLCRFERADSLPIQRLLDPCCMNVLRVWPLCSLDSGFSSLRGWGFSLTATFAVLSPVGSASLSEAIFGFCLPEHLDAPSVGKTIPTSLNRFASSLANKFGFSMVYRSAFASAEGLDFRSAIPAEKQRFCKITNLNICSPRQSCRQSFSMMAKTSASFARESSRVPQKLFTPESAGAREDVLFRAEWAHQSPYGFRQLQHGEPVWKTGIRLVSTLLRQIDEDPPENLPADQSRREEDWDRLEALAHFSAARLLENRGQLNAALRRYQRGVRYDPESAEAARAAMNLAIKLRRMDEAARLVKVVSSPEALDPLQLMQIALHLVRQNQPKEAAELLELVLKQRGESAVGLGDLALRVELGRLYLLMEEFEKAAGQFERALEGLKNPKRFGLEEGAEKLLLRNPAQSWRLFGHAFLRSNRLDAAEECFRQANAREPNAGILGYDLARVYLVRGNLEQAAQYLEDYFKARLTSEGLGPYQLLKEILTTLGRQDELLPKLKTLQGENAEDPALAFILAEEYLAQDNRQAAEELLREWLGRKPSVEFWRLLVRVLVAKGEPVPVLDALAQMVAAGLPWEALGDDLRQQLAGDEWCDRLVSAAAQSSESDAKFLTQHTALASLCIEAERFAEARKFLELLIDRKSRYALEVLLDLTFALIEKERFAEAIEVLELGINKQIQPPDNPGLHYYLAGVLAVSDRLDEAVAAASQAAQIAPENPRMKSRLAAILVKADRREEADRIYREIIDRWDSEFSSAEIRQVLLEARLALSHLATLAGNDDEAVEWLEQVLDEFPEDPGALNDLGYLWADKNMRLQRAYRMIQQAVTAAPDNAAYRDSLGWVLYRLGRYQEAVKELEKAAEQEPDPVILDHLGDAYHAVGRTAEAVEAWRRALEGFRNEKDDSQAEKVAEKLRKLAP